MKPDSNPWLKLMVLALASASTALLLSLAGVAAFSGGSHFSLAGLAVFALCMASLERFYAFCLDLALIFFRRRQT